MSIEIVNASKVNASNYPSIFIERVNASFTFVFLTRIIQESL